MQERLMPHFAERKMPVEMVVLHCSAFPLEKCLEIWDDYGVSPHYAIDEQGELFKLVDEKYRAYHAGKGYWYGREGDMNEGSIGIELVNMSLGQKPDSYTEAQLNTLIPLLQNLIKKYNIKPQNIVGHSDIAPLRKADPGLAFPWEKLAQHGIGRWYNSHRSSEIKSRDAVSLLKGLGYDTRDEETAIASAYAFRRHYLPEEVKVDPDMQHLLDNVYPKNDKSLLTGEAFISALNRLSD